MSSVPNRDSIPFPPVTIPRTEPEDVLRAGIAKALEHLDNKRPGRARYTLTRALIKYDRARSAD